MEGRILGRFGAKLSDHLPLPGDRVNVPLLGTDPVDTAFLTIKKRKLQYWYRTEKSQEQLTDVYFTCERQDEDR
jgi:hypothetical protein